MDTPNGLRRFARSMRTRYSGTCHFCGAPTTPHNDYAAQTGSGWLAVCIPCSESVVAQVRGTYRRIHDMVTSPDVTPEMKAAASVQMPDSDKLKAAMGWGGEVPPDTLAFDVLVALLSVIPALKAVDPMSANLQALADNPNATPHHRTVAASMVTNIARYGKLTDKQRSYAQSLCDQYANGATPAEPAADAPTIVEGGFYVVGADLFKVVKAKAGHLYAMILMTPSAGRKFVWEFSRGGINLVRTQGTQITAEQAATMGKLAHHCVFCNRSLKDDGDNKSIDVGYGPHCASQRGLPWG